MKKLVILLTFWSLMLTNNQLLQAQTTYYISNTGSNTNDGKTPASAWKTLNEIKPGNTYLLHSGDTFSFTINHIDNPAQQKITISSYGQGDKPVIDLYKSIKPSAWHLFKDNIWQVDLRKAENYTGFSDTTDTNVGFLKVNGDIKGVKRSNLDFLNRPWEFYSDRRYLYVYFPQSPIATPAVKAVVNKTAISLIDNMDISNISIIGTGAHGIRGGKVANITLRNIKISEIGGSYLIGYHDNTTRYGNGIEFGGAINVLVTGCDVSDVYDVAYTLQTSNLNAVFENVVFSNNLANDNEQSFEFWAKDKSASFINCKFINNTCTNAGYGWSHSVRPDPRGVHLLVYSCSGNLSGLTIANNTFKNAIDGYIYLSPGIRASNMFTSDNNKVYLKNNIPVLIGNNKNLDQKWKDLKDSIRLEKHSTFSNSQ